jgi:NTE family protein
MSLALVLGGGGVTGIAWETGMLRGLVEAGVDLTRAELVIGTSAGSVVGTVVATDQDIAAFHRRLLEPYDPKLEPRLELDLVKFASLFTADGPPQLPAGEIPQSLRARIGQFALTAPVSFSEDDRMGTIASRIRVDAWPNRELMVTGVACDDGEFVVWTRDSGVPLLRAVTASCAVPTVSPPITIGSRRYMDGGMRSGTNADLARGYDRVVVLAPLGPSSGFGGALLEEVAELRSAGARVSIAEPDGESLAAIGPNVLDPERRAASAEAGYEQGGVAALELRELDL